MIFKNKLTFIFIANLIIFYSLGIYTDKHYISQITELPDSLELMLPTWLIAGLFLSSLTFLVTLLLIGFRLIRFVLRMLGILSSPAPVHQTSHSNTTSTASKSSEPAHIAILVLLLKNPLYIVGIIICIIKPSLIPLAIIFLFYSLAKKRRKVPHNQATDKDEEEQMLEQLEEAKKSARHQFLESHPDCSLLWSGYSDEIYIELENGDELEGLVTAVFKGRFNDTYIELTTLNDDDFEVDYIDEQRVTPPIISYDDEKEYTFTEWINYVLTLEQSDDSDPQTSPEPKVEPQYEPSQNNVEPEHYETKDPIELSFFYQEGYDSRYETILLDRLISDDKAQLFLVGKSKTEINNRRFNLNNISSRIKMNSDYYSAKEFAEKYRAQFDKG